VTARYRPPRWPLAVALLGTAIFALPHGAFAWAIADAASCLDEGRRTGSPDPSVCAEKADHFERLARVPWLAERAHLGAEELRARSAMEAYLGGSVGEPSLEARARGAEAVSREELALSCGSKRLTLGELGPQVGAPNLGNLALLQGDRPTLLAGYDGFALWYVRSAVLDAALIEGDLSRAGSIAARYAEFDPYDPDLRTQVGALLCLGDAPKRGLELVRLIEEARARDRNAAMARDWGAERTLSMACAALAKLPPLAEPEAVAGDNNARDAQAALRLRLADSLPERSAAAEIAEALLLGEPLGSASARFALLASLVHATHPENPQHTARLARPREARGEQAIFPLPPISIARWLERPRAPRTVASALAYEDAAQHLASLADTRGLAELDRNTLALASGALALSAAFAHAGSGDRARREASEQAFSHAAERLGLHPADRALGRSTLLWLADQPDRALTALDEGLGDLAEARPDTRAELHAQRAALLAVVGRAPEAAAEAEATLSAVSRESEPRVRVLAAWTRAAFGSPPAASGPPAWVWAGYASPTWSLAEPWQEELVAKNLAAWEAAVALPEAEQRSARHLALSQRGDAPRALLPYLVLVGRLAGSADTEVWLDAMTSVDARRFSVRAYAFARAQAAFARGAADAGATWRAHERALAIAASDPTKLEIAAYLGL
jgi:hypothetical protein